MSMTVPAPNPALAAGPIAALAAFALHTGIDWDWELPGLTLVALSLAGLLVSRSSRVAEPSRDGGAGPLVSFDQSAD